MADPYDICVIGAGSAGLTVAAAAAQFGERVVLIEKGRMGGECLNTGCVPSKALIAAARHAHAFTAGEPFGIAAAKPDVDFAQVHRHVRGVIAAIAPHDSEERFEGLGVRVIRTAARFSDRQTIDAGGEPIRARRFVVATGSLPTVPGIPGLDQVSHVTSETIFDNSVLPRHLLVIGGGPVGLELAQAHRRLGSNVTVIEALEPLGKDDPELARVVLDRLEEEGVVVHAKSTVTRVGRNGEEIEAEFQRDGQKTRIAGSHLLIAVGRTPTMEGLGLDAAGIAFSTRGITVDKALKTTNPRVYAIGDVIGGPRFTHVAAYHAGLVVRNALFRLPVSASTDHIPWVTFTDPELAQVGLTEAAARERGEAVTVVRRAFRDNDRAHTERRTEGLIKVVVGRGGRIFGASIVGPEAGELIHVWALAIASRLTLRSLVGMVAPYPTLGEISRQAAVAHYAPLASNPWVRRLVGVLKWLP